MAFVNLQVNLADLPTARELEMEPMSPAYIREVKTQLLIIWMPLLMGSFIPSVLAGQVLFLAVPVLLLLLAFLISALVIKKARIKGIALRDHDIASRSGLFWRKTVLLAFDRVQHVEVSSGPLQRKYGLASLKFFTAGGSGVDLKVDGLQRERAEQVRAYILDKTIDQPAA
jgi:membrane protein YdbS with pleckstrin-like domain